MNAAFQSQIAPQPEPSALVARFLQRAPRLFIGGEWVESESSARLPVIDPATGRQIATVADANTADVDRAVAAARKAFESGPWPDMLPADRQALLWKLSDLIEQHAQELAELGGKSPVIVLPNLWAVLVAQRFEDLDDIAAMANDTPYGLAASIWSNDMRAVQRLVPRIRAGTVWVNCHNFVDPNMPFGGFKQSGFGREHGRAVLDLYTELKSVCVAI